MRRSLLCALVFLAHAHASAQERAVAPTGEPAQEHASTPPADYRETIDAAVAEFALGHHAEARALFRRAHASYPSARTLRGIGMCAFELREYADAVRALSEALIDGRRPLTDEQRAQVQATLARAEAFVGRFEVSVPHGVTLFLDGAATPTALEPDGTLLLTLGAHVVRARRDDAVFAEVRVDVQGGERAPLTLVPDVRVDEPPPTRPTQPPPALPTPAAPASDAPDPTPAIALISAGGVALVGGAVLVGLGLADASSVTDAAAGTPWTSLRAAYERAPLLEGLGAALLGAGAVTAIVGGALLATSATGSSEAEAHVVIELGPGSLDVRGVF